MSILHHKYFAPECLTISLGSDCNLNCTYCFSKNHNEKEKLQLNNHDYLMCISKAAELVVSNCKRKNIPFFLGFQGSGEPLMYFDKLKKIYELVKTMVRNNSLKLFSFITSNGCMENEKYEWIAAHFDRICLSIDGNKEINNIHRKTIKNIGSYNQIIETINILSQNNKTPVVRTTVTRQNVNQLARIVFHFIHDLKLYDIQIEPVYRVKPKANLAPSPDVFVKNFLEAKKIASQYSSKLRYSGYRKNENHGVYCNLNKNVLFVGPNGNASICLFKDNEIKESPFVFGHYDIMNDCFIIDYKKFEKLRRLSLRQYRECKDCEIIDSCVKGCPDVCIIEQDINYSIKNSLRCKINRLLFQKEM